MHQVVGYYHRTLKDCPEALAYLEKRGIGNPEMIDHFKIGYANRTLGLRLPTGNRQEGAAIRERLARLGIYRKSGHEHFNGAIVFPIFDENGNVSGIYGRKICQNLTPGLLYHLYLSGPHKGIFNASGFSVSPDLILCEAIIDALSFWCAGFRNVTASYGVNGFTQDHLEAFKKAGIKRIFIAYDRDEAGDSAAADLSKQLINEGYECFRIQFPKGMDANEYSLKAHPPEKSLDVLIRNAVWLGKPRTDEEKKEPAAKEEKQKTGTKALEATSQADPAPEDIFPLAAEKPTELPPQASTDTAKGVVETEIRPEEIIMQIDDRRWRIRGLDKNKRRARSGLPMHLNFCRAKGN